MNSITKIGRMALEKYFSHKPIICNEDTLISKVGISKKIINLLIIKDNDPHKVYRVWSIELGILEVNLKDEQTLSSGILRKLKKLQKEDIPSHVIISRMVSEGKMRITTHTIYRLTDYQEAEMYHVGLFPSVKKRDEAIQRKAIKEHEEYLLYIAEFEKRD